MYALRGLEAFQMERLDEALLQWGELGVADHWARCAARAAVDEHHFFDLRKGFEHLHDAQVNSLVGEGPAQEGAEEQRQHAVEGVHADLLVGPVMQGAPAHEVGTFHSLERLLNLVLAPVGPHDGFVAPSVLIGEQEVLPQQGVLQAAPEVLGSRKRVEVPILPGQEIVLDDLVTVRRIGEFEA